MWTFGDSEILWSDPLAFFDGTVLDAPLLPQPTRLSVSVESIYTLRVTIEDIYTLAAIIED